MKSIKWLKMCYPGMDLGATYPVEKEFTGTLEGYLLITDEFGRNVMLHKCYLGILFTEVSDEP
jgi:hypothetical protein